MCVAWYLNLILPKLRSVAKWFQENWITSCGVMMSWNWGTHEILDEKPDEKNLNNARLKSMIEITDPFKSY